ncbi:MAG TPA: UDP-N-acetylmuramoyl-L-alanine--D-glutamate ligase [Acidimicrobiales bacterium]|nr:UDP-N-acetylmuramoyl-L-alanine--D-glutamate ligase [Acidimicrobiales bacterium]
MRALVLGLAITNDAVVRQVQARGGKVTVLDDAPSDASRERALGLGLELHRTDEVDVATMLAAVDVVLPTPGMRISHPVLVSAAAAGVPVWSEFELAAEWDARPIVAVTGTNGKTTVTTLITSMLAASGRVVVDAGNNDLPLVDALDRRDVELFVVEASSFRLQFTERFRPVVGVWLNLSPDHLDWHPTMDHYAEAKFRIWANQRADDVAIANAEDDEVMQWAAKAPGRVVTYGLSVGDYRLSEGALKTPGGAVIVQVDDLAQQLPHELSNFLAAGAASLEAGASMDAVRSVLVDFRGLPHRVELVVDAGGVRWYDDSKATTPASVLAAVSGFDSAVLIAGGRNKGLDLGVLRPLSSRLRAVVAIGESGPMVASVFEGACPVVSAASMDEAVARAASLAQPGDAVVLSPGCASYDWYSNYNERGDDFVRAVRDLVGATDR